MGRLIDADALLESAIKYKIGRTSFGEIIKCVEDAPTVEAVPVVCAEWIHVESSDMSTGKAYMCSNCQKIRFGSFLPPYCQMCGADMRKDNNETENH